MPKYGLGWKKDVHDPKDFIHKMKVVPIPERVVLDKFLPTVRNQGSVGSCVGFGIGANLTARAKMRGDFIEWFSPTWIYNGARYIEGTLTEDPGCYPRDALDWLLEKGCLLERFWRYNPLMLDKKSPPSSLDNEAAKVPLLAYYRVADGADGICSAISEGFFVSIGTPWFKKWMNPVPSWRCGWKNVPGVLPEVTASDPTVGGHETCFTKDTKIAMLNGKDMTIEQILLEYGSHPFWVYSCNGDGQIVPGVAHDIKKTRNDQQIIKITLDSGESIRCTTDHPFMLRNGEYVKAGKLVEGNSLMPLYRRAGRLGYEMTFNPATESWEYTHSMISFYKYGPKPNDFVDHHVNFDKHNNTPDNIERLAWDEHTKLHSGRSILLKNYAQSIRGRNKSREIMQRLWRNKRDEQYIRVVQNGFKYRARAASEHRLGFQDADKFDRRVMAEKTGLKLRGRRLSIVTRKAMSDGKKASWARNYDSLVVVSRTNIAAANAKQRLGIITDKQRNARRMNALNLAAMKRAKVAAFNHNVVSISEDGFEDVYDFTVDAHHNFALSAGVFVHNCLYGYDKTQEMFYGQNSWGVTWGDKGRYTMPFTAIEVFKELGGYDAHYIKRVA